MHVQYVISTILYMYSVWPYLLYKEDCMDAYKSLFSSERGKLAQ